MSSCDRGGTISGSVIYSPEHAEQQHVLGPRQVLGQRGQRAGQLERAARLLVDGPQHLVHVVRVAADELVHVLEHAQHLRGERVVKDGARRCTA